MGRFKIVVKSIIGFLIFFFYPNRKFILILSTMRSGSTLLKGLVSEAPETDHINEFNFEAYKGRFELYFDSFRISQKLFFVLKKPSGYLDYEYYPKIPSSLNAQHIVLFRNPIEVINSLYNMNKEIFFDKSIDDLIEYWSVTNENLMNLFRDKAIFISYDSLLNKPISTTKKLFQFIDSRKKTGTEKYSKLANGNWVWGKDDGGEKIKKFIVVREKESIKLPQDWINEIHNCRRIQEIYHQLILLENEVS